MNFFEHQHHAKRKTRLLLVLFGVATLLIVAAVNLVVAGVTVNLFNPEDEILLPDRAWFQANAALMGISTTATMVIILAASVYKIIQLRHGGGGVARAMGGKLVKRDTDEPLEKRLLNVLDEMSIAAGVPVPEAYVLDRELGINAFAAGFTPSDAAIGVTRGTLERLTRDELQGVIAHEYSHILNGDMRLNMEMMGILHGILVIGLTGEALIRAGFGYAPRRRDSSSVGGRSRGAGLGVAAAGAALVVIGHVGTFFGTLIKAGMSRQREFLADASAVQFTRNPEGIAGALKKIGGFKEHSWLQAGHASEISHMLFGDASSSLFSLLATHPPLVERILAIDPSFDAEAYQTAVAEMTREPRDLQEQLIAGLQGGQVALPEGCGPDGDIPNELFAAFAGQPTSQHLEYSAGLLAALPSTLRDAAGFPDDAEAVVMALLLSPEPASRRFQLDIVAETVNAERKAQVERIGNELDGQGEEIRLPLLDLSFPALRRRSSAQTSAFLGLCHRLIEADGVVEPFEYALYRVLQSHLIDAADPSHTGYGNGELARCVDDAATLLAMVAKVGHDNDAEVITAFRAGLGALEIQGAVPCCAEFDASVMDSALDKLDELLDTDKEKLIEALYVTVCHDHNVTVAESELLRAIAASIHTPIPPLVVGSLLEQA